MTNLKETSPPTHAYEHLYGKQSSIQAVHFMVSNQGAARKFLKDKWAQVVPLLEVQIGKLLKNSLSDADTLLRREALSYYLICDSRDYTETTCFAERLAANVYETIFNADPCLHDLQISLSSITLDTKTIADDASFKANLFQVHAHDGWNSIVARNNFAALKPEQLDHALLRQIAAIRGKCDQFFSELTTLPKTDEELKAYHPQLQKLQQVTEIVSGNIAKLLKDIPIEETPPPTTEITPEPAAVSKPEKVELSTEEQIQLDAQKQIGPDAEVAYFPVWNVPRQVIDIYRCSVIRHLPSGVAEVNTGTETQHASHVVDNLIVRKVLEDLELFTDPSSNCLVYLPLHANTIQSKTHFQSIVNKLKPLSMMERKQLLIGVTGVTQNTTSDVIQKLAAAVRPYARTVNFRFTGENRLSGIYKKAGADAIGLHVDDLKTTTADITTEITHLAEQTEANKLMSFVEGVHTVATAAAAIGSGITFISGDAVGVPLEMPWGAVDFKVESLYSKVLSS